MADRARLQAHYGLKDNPFLPAIPEGDLFVWPGVETFAFRLESLVLDGGFALLSGEPGLGKSKTLQYLAARLGRVASVEHEVDEDLLQRPRVGHHEEAVGLDHGAVVDVGTDGASQHAGGGRDEIADVGELGVDALTAGEREQLLSQLGGLVRCCDDVFERIGGIRACRHFVQRIEGIAEHHGEQVV
ncbi:MAG: hypothetical protein AAF211_16935, partial [Myxococcota bacterium]